ncbi:MAG: alpha/beta fold hydrolase, partial [Nocardioidaceae bacterium]|nr:alpha/beta fold hydrolase [Nocardioidaceae bacterium]
MSKRDTAWNTGEEAAATLAPESSLVARLDSSDFGGSLKAVARRAAAHPASVAAANLRFASRLAQIGPAAFGRWLGAEGPPPVAVDEKDRRFADQAWEDNPAFFALRQSYVAALSLAEEILEAGRGDRDTDALVDGKAEMATKLLFDALAPTNFLFTNPAALKRAFDTGGASLVAGARHFVDDALHNGGRPQQVDTRPFKLGENLAATPGRVVFRNELMELIQYAPQSDEVHMRPLLASPPWINKYYVMDLAPNRSFIEWAIQHGRTVFAISYRNPDQTMRDVTLDDYLIQGPRTALDVIGEITGADTVDIVGLCMGGALTAMTAAYLTDTGDTRIGSVTLLNTLLDYSNPGAMSMFTDEKTVAQLEKQMESKGFLEGSNMATTFDLMRANDLIFNYVVSNWLMGQDPPAFDILAWNADSTQLPAAMHSFYLRSLYMKNLLAKGELEIAGERLSLSDVKSDAYIVGAINDHIVPWESSYAATHLLAGDVRYVLTSGGHIAGIVNPPNPKA